MYSYPYLPNYAQQNNNIPNTNMNIPRVNSSLDERVWVSNEQAAESFLLAPSSFVRLWDSSTNRFYEKRSDINGRPLPMDVYEYTRILPQNDVQKQSVDNLPMEEINARFEEISNRIEALEKTKKVTKNAKQSDADDSGV